MEEVLSESVLRGGAVRSSLGEWALPPRRFGAMPRTLLDAYIAGDAAAFYPTHFADVAARRAVVARVARPLAPAVADALTLQNERLAASPARQRHLAALRNGAAAVVTGQQVGLFLGPLFTIYKAATTIRLARALAEETGRPVVPVFWLQSEDHDLPEIAVCHTPSPHGASLVSQLAAPDARISIAHRQLPDDVTACLGTLGAALANLPHAAPHLARLARHYVAGTGWVAAFAGVLAELFADEGLVFVDPRDPALAAAAAPVHERALREAAGIAETLEVRSAALADAGFTPAVHVRRAAPLSFFHPDGADGPRFRLTPERDGWALVGRQERCTRQHVLARLDAAPLELSSSALLRPIVQDALLPTAAYVGGPGEVAYFAQLAPLYDAFGVTMPLIVPRARLRVVEAGIVRRLAAWGLSPDDVRRGEDELLARIAAHQGVPLATRDLSSRLLGPFAAALAQLQQELAPLDAGVHHGIEKTRTTIEGAVARLIGKIEQAHRHRDASAVAALRDVRQRLYPHDTPQERIYGLAYFAARYGEQAFLRAALAAAAPFDTVPRDLHVGEEAA